MPVSHVKEGTNGSIVLASRKPTGTGEFSKVLSTTVTETDRVPGKEENSVIELGRISKETPTVSHILIKHPEFSSRCWDIIYSPENRGKQFTKMKEGTVVALRAGSNELVWGKELSLNSNKIATNGKVGKQAELPVTKSDPKIAEPTILAQPGSNSIIAQEPLAHAVRQYIGTPYKEIDCYGLIVRGLQDQGIQYKGPGGIRELLEHLAVRSGLPSNAYFNGEGLVEKAGTRVFSKSISHVSNTGKKTEELFSEIKPYLSEGYILSFSTSSRGHTGIVSKKGEDWTYINSGIIDNEVIPVRAKKGVGEEYLKAEIKNWLKLAAKAKEPLTVTLGHVDEVSLFHDPDVRG